MGWFRAYDGVSTDAKYLLIAQRSGQPVGDVVAVWMHVLDMANQRDVGERGMVDHLDVEALAAFLQRPVEHIEAILTAMRATRRDGSPGMINADRVTAWRKRQPVREDDTAAERKRRQRDKERSDIGERDGERGQNVPPSHAMSRDVTLGPALQEETRQDKTDSESLTPESNGSARDDAAPDGAAAAAARRERKKPLGEPQGFAEFYAAYPRKVARPEAAKAFGKAAARASHETIMSGLERAKAAWARRRTELEHIPHPSTWLNQDRWKDDEGRPPEPNGQHDERRAKAIAKGHEADRLKAARAQCEAEGLHPLDGPGMARVVEILREMTA